MRPLILILTLLITISQGYASVHPPTPTNEIIVKDSMLSVDQKCQLLKTLMGDSCRYRINGFNINFEFWARQNSLDSAIKNAAEWAVMMIDFALRDSLDYFNIVEIKIHHQEGELHYPVTAYPNFKEIRAKTGRSDKEYFESFEKLQRTLAICTDFYQSKFGLAFSESGLNFSVSTKPPLLNNTKALIMAHAFHTMLRWYIYRSSAFSTRYANFIFLNPFKAGHGICVGYNYKSGTYKTGQVEWD